MGLCGSSEAHRPNEVHENPRGSMAEDSKNMVDELNKKPFLSVNVVRARNLMVADSDPYVRVIVRDQSKKQMWSRQTKVVQQSLHPEWNEVFDVPDDIMQTGRPRTLRIEVWDKDMGPDDFLGKIDFRLIGSARDVPDGETSHPLWIGKWCSLERDKNFSRRHPSGGVFLVVKYMSLRHFKLRENAGQQVERAADDDDADVPSNGELTDFSDTSADESGDEAHRGVHASAALLPVAGDDRREDQGPEGQYIQEQFERRKHELPSGPDPEPYLEVHVLKARHLRSADVLGNKSDPYVKIMGLSKTGKVYWEDKTEFIVGDLNPVWNYEVKLPLRLLQRRRVRQLRLECWDKESLGGDDFLGKLVFNLDKDVPDGEDGHEISREGVWCSLASDSKVSSVKVEGDILIKIRYLSAGKAKMLSREFKESQLREELQQEYRALHPEDS